MKKVMVSASATYDVLIGSNLLIQAGAYAAKIRPGCTAAIISDTNVWLQYGDSLKKSLAEQGILSIDFVFPAGESSKNASVYLKILNYLAENEITRADLLIALGGGVVGDMTGFVAATYLRGIAYMQIPTSLLAMVDSSVGGKTAIDLPAGKNLVGAFKQPNLVLCDISLLDTLPESTFIDGCAEIIKYGILYDAEMIAYLIEAGLNFDREQIIAKCVALKADVVAQDEFDNGARQKLNLGHTIGHGIEAGSDFQITHGQAVAAGIAIVTKAAMSHKLCDAHTYNSVISILERFHLPTTSSFSAKELYKIALSDKKRSGVSVNLIVPRQIGKCDILPLPITQLESFIEAGL